MSLDQIFSTLLPMLLKEGSTKPAAKKSTEPKEPLTPLFDDSTAALLEMFVPGLLKEVLRGEPVIRKIISKVVYQLDAEDIKVETDRIVAEKLASSKETLKENATFCNEYYGERKPYEYRGSDDESITETERATLEAEADKCFKGMLDETDEINARVNERIEERQLDERFSSIDWTEFNAKLDKQRFDKQHATESDKKIIVNKLETQSYIDMKSNYQYDVIGPTVPMVLRPIVQYCVEHEYPDLLETPWNEVSSLKTLTLVSIDLSNLDAYYVLKDMLLDCVTGSNIDDIRTFLKYLIRKANNLYETDILKDLERTVEMF